MLENKYQATLIRKLKKMFPGCRIQKLDTGYQQGIPDLLILYFDCWAILEVKKSEEDRYKKLQPNQEYFVETLNEMSFSAFIYPENEEEVLNDLQQAFEPCGSTRFPKR